MITELEELAQALVASHSEVRGELGLVTARLVLELTAEARRSARVSFESGVDLFDIDIRDGSIVQATRTSSDGVFARGELVREQVFRLARASFVIRDSVSSVRESLRYVLNRDLTEDRGSVNGAPGALTVVTDQALESDDSTQDGAEDPETNDRVSIDGRPDAITMELAKALAVPLASKPPVIASSAPRMIERPSEDEVTRPLPIDHILRSSPVPPPVAVPVERGSEPTIEDSALTIADNAARSIDLDPPSNEPVFDLAAPIERAPQPSKASLLVFPGIVLAAVLIAAAFVGTRVMQSSNRRARFSLTAPALPVMPKESSMPALEPDLSADEMRFGTSTPGTGSMTIGAGQGVLRIAPNHDAPTTRVRLDERDLGAAPLELAVNAGRHLLTFERDGEAMNRAVFLAAGTTLAVEVP